MNTNAEWRRPGIVCRWAGSIPAGVPSRESGRAGQTRLRDNDVHAGVCPKLVGGRLNGLGRAGIWLSAY